MLYFSLIFSFTTYCFLCFFLVYFAGVGRLEFHVHYLSSLALCSHFSRVVIIIHYSSGLPCIAPLRCCCWSSVIAIVIAWPFHYDSQIPSRTHTFVALLVVLTFLREFLMPSYFLELPRLFFFLSVMPEFFLFFFSIIIFHCRFVTYCQFFVFISLVFLLWLSLRFFVNSSLLSSFFFTYLVFTVMFELSFTSFCLLFSSVLFLLSFTVTRVLSLPLLVFFQMSLLPLSFSPSAPSTKTLK